MTRRHQVSRFARYQQRQVSRRKNHSLRRVLEARRLFFESLEPRQLLATVSIEWISDGDETGPQPARFRLYRDSSLGTSTIQYSIGGTATPSGQPNADHNGSMSGMLSLNDGQSELFFDVTPIDDQLMESSESVQITISAYPSPPGTQIGANQSTALIADNDSGGGTPTVAATATDSIASEQGSDDGVFRITRDAAGASPLVVNYTLSGMAVNGADYQFLSGAATIPAGATYVDVVVDPIDDATYESSGETVMLMLTSSASYNLGNLYTSSLTIADNDSSASALIAIAKTENASEGGGAGYFRLTRSGSTFGELTVSFSIDVTHSQATAGNDFAYLSGSSSASPHSGSITFPAGSESVDIAVAALADAVTEESESLRIQLMGGSGYTVGSPAASTLWILDAAGSQLPTVAIGKRLSEIQRVVLPAASGGTWTISVADQTSSPLAYGATALDLQTALESLANVGIGNIAVAGSGTLGDPYELTYRGAKRHTNMPQATIDVTQLTGVEQSSASVTTPVEGVSGQNQVFEVVIRSLDPMEVLDPMSGSLRFYWGDPGPGEFPASETPRRSPAVLWSAPVEELEAAIEAIPNIVDAGGTVIVSEIEATGQTRRLRIEFTGRLGNRPISTFAAANDVEADPILDFGGAQALVETETTTIGKQGPTSEVQVITLNHFQGGNLALTWQEETTNAFPFNATAEQVEQALKGLVAIGSGDVAVTGAAGGPWKVTFQGDLAGLALPPLAVETDNLWGGQSVIQTLTEGGTIADWGENAVEGGKVGYFRVHRDGETTEPLVVFYSVQAGSIAQAGVDYETLTGSITIPAGQSAADILVRTIEDTQVEVGESVQVVLTAPPEGYSGDGYELGDPTGATLTIVDNDAMGPTFSVWISATSAAAEGGDDGYFRVQRTAASPAPVTVTYQVQATSTASSSDYMALSGSVTIPAGADSAHVYVRAINDLEVEGTETLQVLLVGVSSIDYTLGSPDSASVSILDNDQASPLPIVKVARTGNAAEGGTAGWFRLARSGSASAALTVNYEISTFYSTAENGTDVNWLAGTSAQSPLSGSVTFAAGSATVDIPVTAVDDALAEGTENLRIGIVVDSPATYALGSVVVGSVQIRDNEPPPPVPLVESLALVNDTGVSATDRVTYDPRLTGVVTGVFGGGSVRVEFDHDGDGVVDGSVNVATSGASFTYDPRTSDPTFAEELGIRTISHRVVHLGSGGEVVFTSRWSFFAFELLANPTSGQIRIDELRLKRDTGVSSTDRVTVNPTLLGSVVGEFAGGTVRIEFDHQGNGSINGQLTVSTSGSAFIYDPRSTEPALADYIGTLRIRYRLVHIDPALVETAGDWADFDLTLEQPPASSLVVQGVHLFVDDEEEFGTGRSLIRGQVTGPIIPFGTIPPPEGMPGEGGVLDSDAPPPGAFVPVEIDTNGDGAADQQVFTGEDGKFTFDPSGLGYGQHTIRLRATEWSTDYAMELRGAWTTFTFTLFPAPGPAIEDVSLVNDTGEFADDGITADPTVRGALAASVTIREHVNVEFEWTGDETVDGDTWTDELGDFEFAPRGLTSGPITLRARGTRWDSILNEEVPGPWFTFNFTYDGSTTPSVQALVLVNDTGSSATDNITYRSTLAGTLSGGDELGGIEVQFDHNGDDTIDGVTTSQADGQFLYEPSGLTPGIITVRARTAVWSDNAQAVVFSNWTSLTFTLENLPNTPVSVAELELLDDTGTSGTDLITTNPTLVGQLENDGPVGQLVVEFDHDGDGDVDAVATAGELGDFVYLPRGLAAGSHTVRARAIEWNYQTQQNLVGSWTSITFQLEAAVNVAPVIESLGLLSDSGASHTDNITANPTLIGTVMDDRSSAGLGVEFDYDGDGVVDAHALTNDKGEFLQEPKGLAFGAKSIRARAVEWDAEQETYLRGAWSTPISFTYEAQSNLPAKLIELVLDDPLPGSHATGQSFRGRITNEGDVAGVAIEFDYDLGGQVDQSTQTDREGRFALQPTGLTAGPITIQVRTRETDPVTRQILLSAWQSYAFDYESVAPAMPQVTAMSLVNDTGTSSTDNITSDPKVTGTVSSAGASGFVVVQFDHNGDDIIDGDVVAGNDLQFSYEPPGLPLGQLTLRARTKDYDQNSAAVYGAWFELPFELLASSTSALSITQLVLASDTGSSATDGSTSDAALAGEVAGVPGSTQVTIQFDHDGDGTADGTTSRAGSGSFNYTPQDLPTGLNTVFARAVPPSGSTLSASSWVSISFVYSTEPDGAEAQALVPLLATLNGGNASAQSAYQGSLATAGNDHRDATSTADNQYDSSVQGAVTARNQSIDTAEDNFQSAVQAADAAYLAALDAAAAALATDLSNFGGDTTSYEFSPFVWPAAPHRSSFELPPDSAQPHPPVAPPIYSGPKFSPSGSQGSGVSSAAETLRAARKAAQDAYDDGVEDANEQYRQDLKDAEGDYRDGLNSAQPPFDLNAEYEAHQQRVQDAYDIYKGALETSANVYKSAMEQASAALQQAVDSANQTFDSTVQPAYQNYIQTVMDPNATWSDKRNAYLNYQQAVFDADKTRDGDIADARRQYDTDASLAGKKKAQTDAAAQKTYSNSVAASQNTLDKKNTDYRHWQQTHKINLREAYEHDKVEAARIRTRAIVDAQRTLDEALANAVRQHELTLATETVSAWQGDVGARLAATQAWHLAQQTPWSAYQLALVSNESQYISQRATAYTSKATAVADAKRDEALAVANAAKTRGHDRAEIDAIRDHAWVTAKGKFWRAPADAEKTRAYAVADHRKVRADEYALAVKTAADKSANASDIRNNSAADAYHGYDTDVIGARQFQVDSDPADPCYWSCQYVDGAALVNFAADRDLDLAQSHNVYVMAGLDLSKIYHDSITAANKKYRDDNRTARGTEESGLRDALEEYHKGVALADKVRSIDVVEDLGIEQNAVAAAHVAFVSASALAEKTYAVADAQAQGTRKNADAASDSTYRSAEAGLYASILTSWDSVEATPWSSYHVGLGQAESTWAAAVGAARVSYASAVAMADVNRATAIANSDQVFANAEASAAQTRTGSLVTASNIYATNVAPAKLIWAEELAEWVKGKEQQKDDARAGYDQDAALFERDESNQGYAAEDGYRRSMAGAMLTYRQQAIAAAAALALSDHSQSAQDTYEQAIDSATDTYNNSVRAAWDTLRTARAQSMVDQHVFYATASETLRLELADDGLLFYDDGSVVSDITAAARILADAVYTQTVTLATANAAAEKAYAAAVANAELTRSNAVISADATHQYAVKTADANEQLARTVADAAKRENVAASRGNYEVALYNNRSAALQSAALSEGTPQSALEAAAAAADAAWADAVRLARDAYHDELSFAAYDQQFAIGTADLALANSVITAQSNHQSAVAAAQRDYSIATANAAADLSLANTSAEAHQVRQELEVRIAYDTEYWEALEDMRDELANANIAYAVDSADAWSALYLANTDEWTEITNLPQYGYGSGQTYYGGGGSPFSWWGGWFSGGFGGFGGAGGGYVMGGWNDPWFGGNFGFGGFGGGLSGFGWGWPYGWGWNGLGWSGWGFGGWDYGWNFGGYGGWGWPWWGWNSQGDEQAWQDYQDDMQQASDARTDLIDAAQLIYVTAIGDAQITRATDLGDLAIDLATARGDAGVAYVTAIQTAEGTLTSAELTAGTTLTTARNTAEIAYSTAVAGANQTKVADDQAAEVGLKFLERAAAVTHAQSVATAEADYHITIANQYATAMDSWATAAGTAEAEFRALNAQAQADWLDDAKPAYVTHASALAQADGDRAYNLAIAWELRENQRAAAEANYAIGLSNVGAARIAGEVTAQNALRSTVQTADSARASAGAANTKAYEIAVATAEKAYAIDYATADKDYHIGRVQHESLTTLADERKTARADALLEKSTGTADAKQAYLQAEIAARKNYTVSAAGAQTVLEGSLANLARTAAIDAANYEAALDNAFAQAEGTYWYWETIAENIHRASQATADAAWWLAQENASITGVQTLDTAVNLPWTDYLVDRAVARRDWWVNTQDDYLLWINDRNVAEAAYQASLSVAHINQGAARATADVTRATAVADAEWNRASGMASARDAYFAALAGSGAGTGAAQTLLQGQAQAERAYEVAKAQALRNHQVNPNQSVYDSAIQSAETAKKNTLRQLKNTYGQAEASAIGTRHSSLAQAERNYAVTLAAADQTRKSAYATAERNAQVADANAYLTLTTAQAGLDEAYWLFEADSLATSAANLATASATPWADYHAAEMAEYETWVIAAAPAQEQERIAKATAQANAEVGWADAQQLMAIALAGAEQLWTTAVADAQLLLAQAQGALVAAMGSSFGYSPQMPTLGSVPGIDSYAVTAAGETRYYVDVSFAGNLYGWGCSGFFGGGFGCGWGGFGGWWGGWGGYFGGWGFGGLSGYYGYGDWDPITGWSGYNSGTSTNLLSWAGYDDLAVGYFGGFGDPSLPEPKPPLPLEAGYWDLPAEMNRVIGSSSGGYYGSMVAGLVGDDGFADAQESPSLATSDLPVSDSSRDSHDRYGLIQTLGRIAPHVGAFFASRGKVTNAATPERPQIEPAATGSPDASPRGHQAEAPQGSLALASFQVQVPREGSVLSALDAVLTTVVAAPANAAGEGGGGGGEAPAAQPANAAKVQANFQNFQQARQAKPDARQAEIEEREKELVEKLKKLINHKIDGSDVSDFMWGVGEGFVQGIKDGLLGMAYDGVKWTGIGIWHGVQLLPEVRQLSILTTGVDVGADEEAALKKFSVNTAKSALKIAARTPETIRKVRELVTEVQEFLDTEGSQFIEAMLTDDRAYFESRIKKLSPLGKEAMDTVRSALVEIGHFLIDNTNARTLGKIVGQVIYEVVEDAAITAAIGVIEVATVGAGTPVASAAVAVKAAKLIRLVERLGGTTLVKNSPKLLKAVERLSDFAWWMYKFPLCFVAGTPIHTSDGLKNIEDIRPGELVLSRPDDDPTAAPRWQRVLNIFVTHPKRLYSVRFAVQGSKEAETITGTGEHPFYVINRQSFIPAKELAQGDLLSLADGRTAQVIELDSNVADAGQSFTTYNLEVAEDHTYFVGRLGAWVHNTGNPCDEAFELFVNAKRLGKSDVDALYDAKKHLETLKDISAAERAKHLADLEKRLSDLPVARGGAGRKLLRNALGANPYPVPAQAHHIFGMELYDTPLGKKLRGWAIDLNGKDNGVWLPKIDFPGRKASLHRGGPTQDFTNYVKRILGEATSREDALEKLDDIRQQLLSGSLKINNAS